MSPQTFVTSNNLTYFVLEGIKMSFGRDEKRSGRIFGKVKQLANLGDKIP